MSEARKEPTEGSLTKKERNVSPSQSVSERDTGPRDRRAGTPDDGDEYSSELSTRWPYPREGADAFEKVKMVKRIPIVKNPRTFDLIAKFKDFPWTEDTVMAYIGETKKLLRFFGLGNPYLAECQENKNPLRRKPILRPKKEICALE